jgi:hypothetical protein
LKKKLASREWEKGEYKTDKPNSSSIESHTNYDQLQFQNRGKNEDQTTGTIEVQTDPVDDRSELEVPPYKSNPSALSRCSSSLSFATVENRSELENGDEFFEIPEMIIEPELWSMIEEGDFGESLSVEKYMSVTKETKGWLENLEIELGLCEPQDETVVRDDTDQEEGNGSCMDAFQIEPASPTLLDLEYLCDLNVESSYID